MPTVQTVLDALEALAPAETAFEWDRIGLQVGDAAAPIDRVVVALDPSPGAVSFAVKEHAHLLLCHHPVIWDPLSGVTPRTRAGRLVAEMIRRDLAFAAAHTNWDAAPNGINGRLAELLGLQDAVPFGSGAPIADSKLVFFAPKESAENLVDALSEAGAGVIGLYRRCAFSTPGTGTFIGDVGSNPTVGRSGRIEDVAELRIEMRVAANRIDSALAALRTAHPYEEPAYDIYSLLPEVVRPMGRIGNLSRPALLLDFQTQVDQVLSTRSWAFGDPDRRVQRVAVCGGAADDEWRAALADGADVFVTGEVKHHNAVEASECGLAILAAGHYATEHPGCAALAEALGEALPDVAFKLYEPPIGQTGRPLAP